MQLAPRTESKALRAGHRSSMPGSEAARRAAPPSPAGRARESSRWADAGILAALYMLTCAPYPAALGVLSRISALGRRWGAYSTSHIAEWRRRARSRSELMARDDRALWDIRLSRCDAMKEAGKPFWKK